MVLPTGTNDPQRLARLVNELLEADYAATAGRVIGAAFTDGTSGIIQRRVNEVQAEAIRLAALGQKFDADNVTLRALIADVQTQLRTNAQAVGGAGEAVQQSAAALGGTVARQLALPGFTDEDLAQIGVAWNVPDPEALNAAVGFIDNPAWAEEVGNYEPLVLQAIEKVVLRGIFEGWGARRLARNLAERVQTLPVSQADNLMRTLQGQVFREAQLANRNANLDILDGQIRIAALDNRTCLACIALHGETFPANVRIDDHHRGRCTSIPMVRGRDRTVMSGEAWFDSQPEARQLQIAGHANFEAMKAGAATLRDFVQPYQSQVFGDMLRQASLVSILGEQAQEFYLYG